MIDQNGEMKGVFSSQEALSLAREAGLDLVEVSPNADPPVCKILDWGKYNYRKTKQAQKQRKQQKGGDVKQMRFGLKIGDHDLNTKLNKVKKFLESGHKVKLSVFFRGREMAHQDLGRELLDKALEMLDHEVVVEQKPQMQGRYMTTMIRSK